MLVLVLLGVGGAVPSQEAPETSGPGGGGTGDAVGLVVDILCSFLVGVVVGGLLLGAEAVEKVAKHLCVDWTDPQCPQQPLATLGMQHVLHNEHTYMCSWASEDLA